MKWCDSCWDDEWGRCFSEVEPTLMATIWSAIWKWRYTFCFFGRGCSVGKCLLLIRSMPCGMRVTHVGRHISPPWFGPAVRTGRHVHAEGKHSCVLSRRENSSQIRGGPNSTGTEKPHHLSLPNAVFLPDKSPPAHKHSPRTLPFNNTITFFYLLSQSRFQTISIILSVWSDPSS